MEQNRIRHEGTVCAVEGGTVTVRILQMSACSACQAKKLCRISESKEKEIQVQVSRPAAFRPGQRVVVEGSESQGFKAVLLAFGYPMLLLLAALVSVIAFGGNEKTAVLAAFGTLVVYYIVLFMNRHKMEKEFRFSLTEESDA